jgi:hypothetical protein
VPNAWDRRENEPNMWYDRFVRYYLSKGSGRSILGAFNNWRSEKKLKQATGAPMTWINASERHEWAKRAEAYDADLRAKDAVIWEQRRLELQQRDWDIAHKLTDKVLAMLNFPVSEQHIEQDGKSVTIYPAKWGARDMAQIAKTASEMARLAAGLATERQERRDVGSETVETFKADWDKRRAEADEMLRDFEEQ